MPKLTPTILTSLASATLSLANVNTNPNNVDANLEKNTLPTPAALAKTQPDQLLPALAKVCNKEDLTKVKGLLKKFELKRNYCLRKALGNLQALLSTEYPDHKLTIEYSGANLDTVLKEHLNKHQRLILAAADKRGINNSLTSQRASDPGVEYRLYELVVDCLKKDFKTSNSMSPADLAASQQKMILTTNLLDIHTVWTVEDMLRRLSTTDPQAAKANPKIVSKGIDTICQLAAGVTVPKHEL